MRTRKPSSTQRAAELKSIEMLPKKEGKRRTDDLLLAMLNSPPEPHVKSHAKPKKRAKK